MCTYTSQLLLFFNMTFLYWPILFHSLSIQLVFGSKNLETAGYLEKGCTLRGPNPGPLTLVQIRATLPTLPARPTFWLFEVQSFRKSLPLKRSVLFTASWKRNFFYLNYKLFIFSSGCLQRICGGHDAGAGSRCGAGPQAQDLHSDIRGTGSEPRTRPRPDPERPKPAEADPETDPGRLSADQ